MRQPDGPTDIARYHSSQTPNAEGRYVGRNFSRYVSAELDTLIDRYLSTIPWPERMQALRAIVRYMSEGATVIGFFYDVDITFMSTKLKNVGARQSNLWDIQGWDVVHSPPAGQNLP